MKSSIVLMIMAALAPLVLCYDEKFDKIDVDKIIADDTLFDAYVKCMLDRGPCDQEHAADFKTLLPEIVQTACAKCTATQMMHIRKLVKHITHGKPEHFKDFIEKYDPKREYETAFAAFLLQD